MCKDNEVFLYLTVIGRKSGRIGRSEGMTIDEWLEKWARKVKNSDLQSSDAIQAFEELDEVLSKRIMRRLQVE